LPKQKLVVRSVRLDADLNGKVEHAAKQQGFANASAFIREAIKRSVCEQDAGTNGAEERIAASIDRVITEIRRVRRVQQAAFAFADAQAKMLLTCITEPPKEAYEQAIARGKLRYDRFLKSVGMGMTGDSADAIKELLSRGDEE
jgi:Arc/MetJ-type ribon-helix-helix transcriptional regulator